MTWVIEFAVINLLIILEARSQSTYWLFILRNHLCILHSLVVDHWHRITWHLVLLITLQVLALPLHSILPILNSASHLVAILYLSLDDSIIHRRRQWRSLLSKNLVLPVNRTNFIQFSVLSSSSSSYACRTFFILISLI